MNRLLAGFAVLIILTFFSSCSKKTVMYQADGKMEDFSPVYTDYDYMSAKAKVVIEEESGKVTRGSMNLRAKKDSVLWFTISPGMGMEAVRGLITQEKIQIKDRIGKENINLTFKEFEQIYGLKLSLDVFQNLLFANPPFQVDYKDRLVRVGKSFELTQVRDKVRYFSKVDVNYRKVAELVSNSLDDRGSLLASYATFQDVNEQPFPAEVLYKLAYQLPEGGQNTIIHVEWISVEPYSNSLSFPFKF
ncbi:DUF4292 domain-containing protein [Algoriphagus halophytocola]|uniref:DUF4292 domain-containing protein n=1 Tax=Algoriphagus halophytocola TaxID=2991499 RepID=A0ABY6MM70_9BACT|nr:MULTISPECIES: DUF4292 domain-containing protein [unclassified Algoriphagus]UZD24268.1 DUF4292 domain-containing protein [Algoriphagus sp. TR-M5]WBL41637.1 DUF4292 domain-containing protein [Algoriphagus sp. TR-M9]